MKNEKNSIRYLGDSEGFCEHCGYLKDGIDCFEYNGLLWCYDCMCANGFKETELDDVRVFSDK